jgi:hypothetical protein
VPERPTEITLPFHEGQFILRMLRGTREVCSPRTLSRIALVSSTQNNLCLLETTAAQGRNSKANETRRLSRRASGLELELSKHHYFSDAISTTSSFDWFFANSVCRELILIWLPTELFRFHTSARKYCWP